MNWHHQIAGCLCRASHKMAGNCGDCPDWPNAIRERMAEFDDGMTPQNHLGPRSCCLSVVDGDDNDFQHPARGVWIGGHIKKSSWVFTPRSFLLTTCNWIAYHHERLNDFQAESRLPAF